ncbi:MAG TPA: hypothetical protein VHQ42_04245 [Candidatus Limnocylindria bacterium]|nr:hypothetical protein [Candidatus Limnocylindria bacterium]
MSIDALLFVNWIFWAALSAGTLLVVGLTEVAGGTTRGYRLFMAGLLVVFAAILVASDLALPPGTPASATEELRRPLSFGFAAGTVAYLVASVLRWPRAWLAVATGGVGLAALVVLAAAGGSRSAPIFASQLILAALALGAVNAGMLLGHWYLVTPKLSPTPLRRMMWLLIGVLVVQGLAFGLALAAVGTDPISGELAWLTWLRLGVGILLPIVATVLAMLASRAASLQASTGLLYIGLALVMAGSIAGASITYLTGVPV